MLIVQFVVFACNVYVIGGSLLIEVIYFNYHIYSGFEDHEIYFILQILAFI